MSTDSRPAIPSHAASREPARVVLAMIARAVALAALALAVGGMASLVMLRNTGTPGQAQLEPR